MSNIFEIDGDIEDNKDELPKKDKPISHEDKTDESSNQEITDNEQDENPISYQFDEVEASETADNEEDNQYAKIYDDDDSEEVALMSDEEERLAYERVFGSPPSDENEDNNSEEEEITEEVDKYAFADETTEDDNEEDEYASGGYQTTSEENNEDEDLSHIVVNQHKASKKKTEKSQAKSEDREPTFEELFPPRKKVTVSNATLIFASLFLATFSMLCYFQFYDGNSFSLNFKHKTVLVAHATDTLSKKVEEVNKQNQELSLELNNLTEILAQLRSENSGNQQDSFQSETAVAPQGINVNEGTVYQIQVAALRNFQPQENDNIFVYIDKEDGLTKMLVGAFISENEALSFSAEMKKAGFGDAFVVKKENGQRVEYNPFKR